MPAYYDTTPEFLKVRVKRRKAKNAAKRARKALPAIAKASNVKRPVKQLRSRAVARAALKAQRNAMTLCPRGKP